MKNIFAGFNRMCGDIENNTSLKYISYGSIKQIVAACIAEFEGKYGSLANVNAVNYRIDEIEELYGLIDSGLQGVDIGIRGLVEKHLFQNLIAHVKELEEIYKKDSKE